MKKFGLAVLGLWAFLCVPARAEICANSLDLPNCDVDAERKSACAPDYTVYSIPLQKNWRAGATASRKAVATGLSAIVLFDTTRIALEAGAEGAVDVTDKGGFGGGKATLSMRRNFKKDECSKNWFGADVDVSGRYSKTPGVDSYLSANIPVYIGQFFQVNGKCTLQIYERAGVAVFDNRSHVSGPKWHDRWLKPFVGMKGVYRCREGIHVEVAGKDRLTSSVSLTVDHLFDVDGADTDLAAVEFSKTWALDTKRFGKVRIGLYSGLEYNYEWATNFTDSRNIGILRGGVQVLR